MYIAQKSGSVIRAHVINFYVTDTNQPLEDVRRTGNILNVMERDGVAMANKDAVVDFNARVCQRVADGVAPDVAERWSYHEQEPETERDRSRNSKVGERNDEQRGRERRREIANRDENKRRAKGKDHALSGL